MRFPNKVVTIRDVGTVLPFVDVCCTHTVDRATESTPRNECVDVHSVEIALDKAYVRFVGNMAYVDLKSIMHDRTLTELAVEIMDDYAAMEASIMRNGDLWG